MWRHLILSIQTIYIQWCRHRYNDKTVIWQMPWLSSECDPTVLWTPLHDWTPLTIHIVIDEYSPRNFTQPVCEYCHPELHLIYPWYSRHCFFTTTHIHYKILPCWAFPCRRKITSKLPDLVPTPASCSLFSISRTWYIEDNSLHGQKIHDPYQNIRRKDDTLLEKTGDHQNVELIFTIWTLTLTLHQTY